MDSTVWGMMPSSAATTRMATSVIMKPRARIAVKASWPGVSRKVMGCPDVHLIGADVLGNAAGLARRHVGVADIVQQGGLAVVDVAHDHHPRGAGLQILLLLSSAVSMSRSSMVTMTSFSTLQPSSIGNDGGGVEVDDLAEGGHDAHSSSGVLTTSAPVFHAGSQFAHADGIGDLDSQRSLFGDLQLEAAHLLRLLLELLPGPCWRPRWRWALRPWNFCLPPSCCCRSVVKLSRRSS